MKTNYKLSGTPNSPVLVFSNSLGTDMSMWDEVIHHLLPYFQILQYDTRGLGKSQITTEPYTIQLLGQDVIDLLDTLNIEKAHFCGLSMGGLIGQWLAIHHSERFPKIILSNTAAKIGNAEGWNSRIETIQKSGLEFIAAATMECWFTADFIAKNAKRVAETHQMFIATDVLGYSNCCEAIRDADFTEDLHKIKSKILVIAGNEDTVTTIEDAEFLVNKIPESAISILPARHLSSTELPEKFAKVLIEFIVGESTFDKGMHVRRTVLGNVHVDKASQNINEFNGEFQEFISNYAWGEIWTRPGLSKHNRSLITIAMLIALNRKAELQMHIKAAFNNGVSKAEIKEVLMQSALYCGLPAANDAIHTAEDVFKEMKI
ncbi:3-oxoadipate enol-lactonase/4-carboxymuconolactone decarboxylase [Flavobacterium sp. PL11]|uniref:bifunctional 3-oxoadipate enol-lactonase/4-carboxymuconolactone decarboxylase PcaDC n=1 Tax=Flavobacterium sp. PL11 TaxID=3071717 RepID=UPI002E008F0B|nr:3-oxoadipate enol-lactonase/4-carboxymuconolactone decarboxylase [Flavobacterium sp. PL11]